MSDNDVGLPLRHRQSRQQSFLPGRSLSPHRQGYRQPIRVVQKNDLFSFYYLVSDQGVDDISG